MTLYAWRKNTPVSPLLEAGRCKAGPDGKLRPLPIGFIWLNEDGEEVYCHCISRSNEVNPFTAIEAECVGPVTEFVRQVF